jgi:hypothetical protein
MHHSASEAPSGVRRQTGVVGLILDGERPPPISSQEIVQLGSKTEFVDDARFAAEYEGGRVEYVPATLSENAVLETLSQGRLTFRFTIIGEPPDELRSLKAGTYYNYVDFVEGPDFDEGRWVARVIDANGELVGFVPGVEVKQVASFHIDEGEREHHKKPEMHMHGLGAGPATQIITGFKPPTSTDKWIVTSGDWTPFGTSGCLRTFYCEPAPVVAITQMRI